MGPYASTMTDAHANPHDEVGARVSEQLKSAFADVAAADIDGATKGRWQRRLLAITNTSKHDVVRAAEQLDRYQREWNTLVRGKEHPQ